MIVFHEGASAEKATNGHRKPSVAIAFYFIDCAAVKLLQPFARVAQANAFRVVRRQAAPVITDLQNDALISPVAHHMTTPGAGMFADSVPDCVLYQRLAEKRRHQRIAYTGSDVNVDALKRSSTAFLNAHIGFQQSSSCWQ